MTNLSVFKVICNKQCQAGSRRKNLVQFFFWYLDRIRI